MTVTIKDVERIATLARLEFTDQEKEKFAERVPRRQGKAVFAARRSVEKCTVKV